MKHHQLESHQHPFELQAPDNFRHSQNLNDTSEDTNRIPLRKTIT